MSEVKTALEMNEELRKTTRVEEFYNVLEKYCDDYNSAQAKIKELESQNRMLNMKMMNEHSASLRVEKLEQANRAMREALEEVRDKARSLTPYTSYAMECIADEAINQVKEILGE